MMHVGTSLADEVFAMTEIRRILCPIDFSDESRHALAHAIAVAGWYGSAITLLHASHPEAFTNPPLLFDEPPHGPALIETAMRAAEEEMRKWSQSVTAAGISADTLVERGYPVGHILARAAALPADLIVMGTHGRSGFERLILGSVTEKVLRKATCPVMAVPPPAVSAGKLPYTRLLCPVDFSDSSEAALRFACSLAEEADARVTIVHVFDWHGDDDMMMARFDTAAYFEAVERQARERLDGLVTDEARVWCKPETVTAHGKPYREILALADANDVDLIVLGVRGRNPIDLALFGSTANQIVRRARCPVLTVPAGR
jgi:nucleotide-binding universal stress UspA family protein